MSFERWVTACEGENYLLAYFQFRNSDTGSSRLDSLNRSLSGFDQQLHSQYGRYASAPVRENEIAAGRAVPKSCGPYNSLMIQARNLVSRRPAMAVEWSDYAFLLMQLDGQSDVVHCGKSQRLERGDVFIMDSRAPLEIAIPDRTRSVCISMERADILALPKRPEDLFGSKISGAQGLPNILAHMLRALMNDAHVYESSERRVLTNSVLSIIDQHISTINGGSIAAVSECDLVRRIKAWITDNLDESELDVAQVAQHFNMSRSSLYRLFGMGGETPKNWIMQQRLMRACDELVDPRRKHLSISTICYMAGFNDAAHFSRLFRQSFGESPTEFRKARLY